MSFATVAPTIAPPSWPALLAGARALLAPGSAAGVLEAQVAALYPAAARVVPFGTGRAALAEALRIAMRATGRRRVVLPAYTSYSVAAAATAAGAEVTLCDLDRETLGLDRASLRAAVGTGAAALVLGNLFGYPDRTDDLAFVREAGTLIIDDAAQALGARERGALVGSRGQLGILSFGRGKCVSLGQAGALMVFDAALAESQPPGSLPPGGRGAMTWLMVAATRLMGGPLGFGLLSRVPGAGIGESHYRPAFEADAASASSRALASDLQGAVARQLAIRQRVAGDWQRALEGVPGLSRPVAVSGSEPAYLRVPVLAPDTARRSELVARLAHVRFRYIGSFPETLGRLAEFRSACRVDGATPAADDIAERLIALPCHLHVGPGDIRRAAVEMRAVGVDSPSAVSLSPASLSRRG